MGNPGSKLYKNGDIPRTTWDVLYGPSSGSAYYLCSKTGNCSKCGNQTNWWIISIKEEGKYLCKACDHQIQIDVERTTQKYLMRLKNSLKN